ncbi:S-layer homology domain-containing protein [Bacillus massiliigorillae]|uniref:S-layer homology domain-containing protein n=1 Tax=Bacillus massiliigorillae TaxID=1243664 RepID=UPI0003A51D17|nr:S-layer homology domain-containing protein [Bacillus massiliigorillae]
MAYQTKRFHKFISTAVTAGLVASAVAPIGAAAAFKDVQPQYKEAVDYVTSKGVQGFSNTEFGVYQSIKRVDAAVMLVKVLGLNINNAPASGFKDVPQRAVKYINALKAAGITNGTGPTTFNSDGLITRGELAVWIQRGYKLKGSSSIAFNDVPSYLKGPVSALVENNVTKGLNSTTFGTQQNAKRGDFANFLLRASKADPNNPTVPPTPAPEPVVLQEVKATSSNKVELTFSQPVDWVDKSQFKVQGATVTSVKLSSTSYNKVILTVSGLEYDKSYKVTTSGLKSNGAEQYGLTGTFQSVKASEALSLSITSKSGVVQSNNSTQTEIKFQLKDKTTNDIDTDADNIVLDLSASYGSLGSSKVTMQDGEATVILTTPASNSDVSSTITAKVVDTPSNYKTLINDMSNSHSLSIKATADRTPFTINSVKGYLNGNSPDTIEITFSEGVQYNGGSNDATNISQYTLNGYSLPSSSSIKVRDGNNNLNDGYEIVVITLPDGTLSRYNYSSNTITVNKNLLSYDNTLISGTTERTFYSDDYGYSDDLSYAGTSNGSITVRPTGSSYITYGPTTGTRTIKGDLTIDGSASSSINLRNITVEGNLIIDTPNASVSLDSSVRVTGTTTIKNLSSYSSYGFTNNGQLGTVSIDTYGSVTLGGYIPTVYINRSSTVTVTGSITKMYVNANLTLNGTGTVYSFEGAYVGSITGTNPSIPNNNDRTRAIAAFQAEVKKVNDKQLNTNLYTVESWNALRIALDYYVYDKTAWEINQATIAIQTAFNGLKLKVDDRVLLDALYRAAFNNDGTEVLATLEKLGISGIVSANVGAYVLKLNMYLPSKEYVQTIVTDVNNQVSETIRTELRLEALKYESSRVIPNIVIQSNLITDYVKPLVIGQTPNNDISVTISGKVDPGNYISIDSTGKQATLNRQAPVNATDNTALITLTFAKGNETFTKEVTVTVQPVSAQ